MRIRDRKKHREGYIVAICKDGYYVSFESGEVEKLTKEEVVVHEDDAMLLCLLVDRVMTFEREKG